MKPLHLLCGALLALTLPAAGCAGEVVQAGAGGGHAGWPRQQDNPPGCPPDESALGQPCPLGAEPPSCAYEHDGCTNAITCQAGSWSRSRVYGDCVGCPPTQPDQSTSCSSPFITCIYAGTSCDYYAECAGSGSWVVQGGTSQCAAPCPSSPPPNGASCESWMGPCDYPVQTPCGQMDQQATCEQEHWSVSEIGCP